MKIFKRFAILTAALAVLTSFSGCSDENDSGSNSNVVFYDDSSNSYVNPNEKDQIARDNSSSIKGTIGEVTSIGGFDINIKNIILVNECESSYLPDQMAEMLAIKIEITNNNTETLGASALADFKFSVDGDEYLEALQMQSSLIALKTIDDYEILNSDIEPGQTVIGYIAFEAVKDWKKIDLIYTPQSTELSYNEASFEITPDMVEKTLT